MLESLHFVERNRQSVRFRWRPRHTQLVSASGILACLLIAGGLSCGDSDTEKRERTPNGAEKLRETSTETAVATPAMTATPVPTTRSRTPTSSPLPTPTPTLVPSPTPPSPPPTKLLTPTPTPVPVTRPDQRHIDEKLYMLELINSVRLGAGVTPVVLGDNIAAQLHAEASLEGCFSSHWGLDGLKPYMRYSLAGGYQSNAENTSGLDYCIRPYENYWPISRIELETIEAMEGWMSSPGHRDNILRAEHKKVNIGLAWDRYNFTAIQHFEGDYVEYDQLPSLKEGVLSLSGKVVNGATFRSKQDLGVQIYFDPPPQTLTRGQLSRTYCYGLGILVAAIRPPLTGNSYYTEDKFRFTYQSCPDPYNVSPDALAPRSPDEALEFWATAYNASIEVPERSITVPWITALDWTATSESFSLEADLSEVLDAHGPGVYRVTVWGLLGGESVVVSEYSIFHDVVAPDTYDPGRYESGA